VVRTETLEQGATICFIVYLRITGIPKWCVCNDTGMFAGLRRDHDMFHDMLMYWSGLRRVQGTENETLTDMSTQDTVCLFTIQTWTGTFHNISLLTGPRSHDMFHDMFVH